MDQRKAATVFTTIIFIIAVVLLRMHFMKPTESDMLVKRSYLIESLQTPYTAIEARNYPMKITATQKTELYVEIRNPTNRELNLDEKIRLYTVNIDGSKMKVNEANPIRVYVGRGTGRAEIVKKIPAGGTREAVLDCSSLGAFTPGAYVLSLNGQFVFFELEDNPAV